MRNYKAMGDEKLQRVVAELRRDGNEDFARAQEILHGRGLASAEAPPTPAQKSKLDLRPMLCDEAKEVPVGSDWVIEQKFDGWRFMFERTVDGVKSWAGRNSSNYTGKAPAIEESLMWMPVGTVLDGELVTRDPEIAVSTALASQPEQLRAVIFDVLYVDGTDCRGARWATRRMMLEEMDADGFEDPLVKLSTVSYTDNAMFHEYLVKNGAEGSVSKRESSRYSGGHRSKCWVKVKATATADAIVTGFKDGKAGYTGTIGAFLVDMVDSGAETSVAVANDFQRYAVTERPKDFLGKRMEIKHYGLGKEGVPRSPVFLRWRDDLD